MEFPPIPTTKYLLPDEQDKRIFDKLGKLVQCELSQQEEVLVKLLYSQLEDDWRSPLESFVDQLLVNKKVI